MPANLIQSMGGPWRILSHCTAFTHNTLDSAGHTKEKGRGRCICPHAVVIWRAAHPTAYTRTGIPYRILPECESTAHNTWNAGRRKPIACSCPGTMVETARQLIIMGRGIRVGRLQYLQPRDAREGATGAATPRLTGLLCRSEKGRAIADGGFTEGVSLQAFAARKAAKDQCALCPAKPKCLQWITEAEPSPGDWGGVWGGQDPWDRRGKPLTLVTPARSYAVKESNHV